MEDAAPTMKTPAPIPGHSRFSTGQTAASHRVHAACTETGISIEFEDGQPPRLWPYASLAADQPLGKSAIDALLHSTTDPGAHLFSNDRPFLGELAARAQHLTPAGLRRSRTRTWIAATLATATALAAFWYSGFSPAALIAGVLPERARTALGEQAIASIVGTHSRCTSDQGDRALADLARRLAKDGSSPHFEIAVVDWDLMNAFAVPGDRIVLTRELLDRAGDADEIAGVLAHEMGHGLKRHPETAFVRAVGLAAAADIMFGGSGGALANVGIVLTQLSYSRASEREADETALRLLKDAKVSHRGLGRFFDRVLKEEGKEDASASTRAILKAASLFRTHPPTEERRQLVEATADYPATPALSPAAWQDLKSICDGARAAQQESGRKEAD